MSFWTSIARWWERRSSAFPRIRQVLDFFGVGGESAAGVVVTTESAMQLAAVQACIRLLAESVASLPLHLYRRLPGGGKERATDHPLYRVLHSAPNQVQTSFDFRSVQMVDLCCDGNSYARVVRDNFGNVVQIVRRHPVSVSRRFLEDGVTLVLDVQLADGKRETLFPGQYWRPIGFSLDGITGVSPITYAREAIGLAIAAERHGARFLRNNGTPPIVLEHPDEISSEAARRIEDDWVKLGTGENAGRPRVIEEGMKAHVLSISNRDAQYLETRKFQVTEIARIFRVPPHMIADLDKATFSNIEHQALEFVVHTLRPWLVRFEQSITRDLLVGREKDEYFAEFAIDGLLRGDVKSRYEAYQIARQNGWLNADDIRELENLNPQPNGEGKVYLVPANLTTLAKMTAPTAAPQAAPPQAQEG